MKAIIAHTSEGRTKILLDEPSENIELYLSNLGGNFFDGFWIFAHSDSSDALEALHDEGYEITATTLL